MNNRPLRIRLFNLKTKKSRNVRLVKNGKEKSYLYASKNCKNWVKKYCFPITFYVFYGCSKNYKGKLENITNETVCNTYEEFELALQSFVKEYYE